MVFTEEDMENDGKIKEELAPKLQSLLSRNNPQIMEFYRVLVEEDYGITTGQDLADMAVRAINDETYADQILNTEISLRQAKISDIREDDLDLVISLREKFEDEDAEDKVGKFIEGYLDTLTSGGSGAIGGLSIEDRKGENELKRARETLQEVRRERAKLETVREDIRSKMGSGDGEEQTDSKDIDDLFDDGSKGAEKEPEEDVEVEVDEKEEETDDYPQPDGIPMSSEEGNDDG